MRRESKVKNEHDRVERGKQKRELTNKTRQGEERLWPRHWVTVS